MELENIAIWNKVYTESHQIFFYIKALIYIYITHTQAPKKPYCGEVGNQWEG